MGKNVFTNLVYKLNLCLSSKGKHFVSHRFHLFLYHNVMSNISVTNTTKLPIHIAMSWKGVIQYYVNDLQPGQSHNFNQFALGWSDFSAVVGTPENKFNHESDFANILAFGTALTGLAVSIAGLVAIPFTGGASTPLVVIGIAAAAAGVSLTGVVIEGIEGALMPASVKALFVSDQYTLNVGGGEVVGIHNEKEKTFQVTEIKPLSVGWKNNTSGSLGTEYAPLG